MGTPEAIEQVDDSQRNFMHQLSSKALDALVVQRLLPRTCESLSRIKRETEVVRIQTFELAQRLSDLSQRLSDDANAATFLWLEPSLVRFCRTPLDGWRIDTFPLMRPDVEEASFCLAFERPTATVFHLMRVRELGLDTLRRMVRVPKKRPGWDGVIEAIDQKLKPTPGARKSAAVRKRNQFIAEAVLLLRAVKEARNTTMHDYTKSYTVSQAIDQYNSVRNFMQKMAEVAWCAPYGAASLLAVASAR